jgi:hypothetical protein
LIVSPGLKAGRSSRSDVLSTKSSVFMSETLPCGCGYVPLLAAAGG